MSRVDHDVTDPLAVAGIVLAAGRSERMGRSKPALTVNGVSFLERAVRVLRVGGCDPVVAVVGRDSEIQEAGPAGIVVNEDASSEQVDSLRLGLDAVGPAVGAVVVLPVDHPLVRPETVAAMVRAHGRSGAPIVRPVHDGVAGHPVLIGRALFPALLEGSLPQGARTLVEGNPDLRLDLDVDDPGVLADIDTPEDYLREVEGS